MNMMRTQEFKKSIPPPPPPKAKKMDHRIPCMHIIFLDMVATILFAPVNTPFTKHTIPIQVKRGVQYVTHNSSK
jgi:hypothetical protein